MLRNVVPSLTNQQILHLRLSKIIQRHISVQHGCVRAKDSTSLGRQGRIISKLFGNRVAGSKKHWYPTHDVTATPTASNIFQATQSGKSAGGAGGKNATRRTTVLNKLFMKHVTDLLATGVAGEQIVGRGLQVTRCKTTKDFAYLNVYWLGSGDVLSDQRLEQDLQRCTGLLRHELSQLRVMGEVPRINFVRERSQDNLAYVDAVLNNLDFGDEHEGGVGVPEEDEGKSYAKQAKSTSDKVREEFYGTESFIEGPSKLPEMRHDVLGLDHRDIMTKILTKMRKSNKAWEMHYQGLSTAGASDGGAEQLDRINMKIAEAAENAAKFDQFLDKRRDRKNTPERKKYSRAAQLEELNAPSSLYGHANEDHNGRRLQDDGDYIHEDGELEKYK